MQTTQDNDAIAKPAAVSDGEADKLVDEARIADELGCSRRVAMQMRLNGVSAPWLRIGNGRGQIRYSLAAFRAWIAARTQGRAA
jgi:hypothetical protein